LKPLDDHHQIPPIYLEVFVSKKEGTFHIQEGKSSPPPDQKSPAPSLSSNAVLFKAPQPKGKPQKAKPTYTLEYLSAENPEAALLGHFTGCCQSLGGAGGPCVEYGIT